jgi:DNA polymerase-3 subunit epsilon
VIEVAAVELFNLLPTGEAFHSVIDPERDIPAEASRIHGFTNGDVAGKPKFAAIAGQLLQFLGDAEIIAHNAPFDFGFLDAELFRCQRPPLDRRRMIDSLAMAKVRFPGMPNNLDALCRRLGVDNSMRGNHNAVLDCQLLAQVYLEMMGGKQPGLELAAKAAPRIVNLDVEVVERDAVLITPCAEALAAHEVFVSGKVKEALWLKPPFAPDGKS